MFTDQERKPVTRPMTSSPNQIAVVSDALGIFPENCPVVVWAVVSAHVV